MARKVKIDIQQHDYEFIDGATGEKISAEEFAKRYPAVGIARHALANGAEEGPARGTETKKL